MKDALVLSRKPTLEALAAFLLLSAGICLLQVSSSAYRSEFGAFPDEAAHVVTGLMVYDFLGSGHYGTPMSYAEDYYLHYPKVALGHWPPGFYMLQLVSNAFGGLFGLEHIAPLLLMAVLGSILACLTFLRVRDVMAGSLGSRVSTSQRRDHGTGWAILLCGLMITTALHQQSVMAVMTELPMALLSFGAALAYGRYLTQSTTGTAYRSALLFALLATAAILTKGSGLLLALIPPGCLMLTRRWTLLRRIDFWLPAAVVALLCGPFYLLTLDMQRNGMMHESPSLGFLAHAVPFYISRSISAFGPAVVAFAALGAISLLATTRRRSSPPDATMLSLLVLIVSVVAFHSLVPAGLEERHLVPALAPMVVLAALGVRDLVPKVARLGTTPRMATALCGLVLIVPAALNFQLQRKDWRGFSQARQALEESSPWQVLLVSSDPQGEGMLIADVALDDGERPSRYALRASKLLARDRWSGAGYTPLFENSTTLYQYLKAIPVEFLVIDTSLPDGLVLPHHRLLIEMVENEPTIQFLGSYPLVRDGVRHKAALRTFRLAEAVVGEQPNVEIDLGAMLGRKIGTTR